MGGLCLVGALVEVAAKAHPFERFNPEQGRGEGDAHTPADEVPDDARELLRALDGPDFRIVELGPVFASLSTCGEDESAAGRLEVEVFARVAWILQKNLDTGVFPAGSAVHHDVCPEAVERFLDGKVDSDGVGGDGQFGKYGGEGDPLVLFPVHVRLKQHASKIIKSLINHFSH